MERERERERERGLRALRQDRRARGTSAHRPGQEAARMEIRPDRFKAQAGKTLGKIHRYTPILNIPAPPLTFPIFTLFAGDSFVVRDAADHRAAGFHPPSSNQ